MIMNRVVIVSVILLFSYCASAQPRRMNLQQCIDTAIRNNIEVRQSQLDAEASRINHNQARSNLLPAFNGILAHGINQGRSIDPFTNSYVNQNINYANYGVSSSVVLFNGMSLQQNIKANAYARDASLQELQGAKDNLTLNVIFAYLQVLNNEDVLGLSYSQEAVSRQQVARLEVLNRQGAISPSQYHDLVGQWKNDELTVMNNRNLLYSSKLLLTQLMNIPFDTSLQLERVGMEAILQAPEGSAADVYSKSMESLAIVKAADLRNKSAIANLRSVKGQLYPTVYLAANVNTNYSSVAMRELIQNVSEVPTSAFVTVNGTKQSVYVQQYGVEKIPYTNQVKNNIFSNFEAGIRFPLFNAFATRNRVRLAEVNVKNTQLAEESTKVQLRQSIEQAQLNRMTAWERYKVLQDQVAAFTASFRAAEIRFNAGIGTSVDYLIAKNNLDRASANLVIAGYDYLLRTRVLNFYSGTISGQ
jgi:outer membrane protein